MSKFKHEFLLVFTCFCQHWYMDFPLLDEFLKRIRGDRKYSKDVISIKFRNKGWKGTSWSWNLIRSICQVVTSISNPLFNQAKLKFDQDFEAQWRFCFCDGFKHWIWNQKSFLTYLISSTVPGIHWAGGWREQIYWRFITDINPAKRP